MSKKTTYKDFSKLCQARPEMIEEIFEFFLTKEELEMLGARYEIIAALMKGELTQREIAKKYKVSIAQITRGSNALKTISLKLKKELENVIIK